jgi:hypothetical protein
MTVNLPYNTDTRFVYFTEHKDETEIFCGSSSYIVLNMTIRVYSYRGVSTFTEYKKEYKFMPFQGKSTLLLGDIISPYFYIPDSLIDVLDFTELVDGLNILPMYKPLEVDAVFKELDYSTNNKISEYSVKKLKFIKGNYTQLSNSEKYRQSKVLNTNSLLSLTFYQEDNAYPISVWKNSIKLPGVQAQKNILSSLLYKDSLQTGDRFEFYDETYPDTVLEKYYVPKKGLNSYYILWLDENLALRFFEFTGSYTVKPAQTLVTNTSMVSGREITRTVESIRGKELTLNTGFIFKDDIETILSIIESEKAWISFDLQKFISFSVTTKELEYNSQQALYDFNLSVSLNNKVELHNASHREFSDEFDFEFN